MPLPDLIEIVPLTQPVQAQITVPGSKSITNRALILAALADGTTVLKGALWSEDTEVMTKALLTLGFDIKVENDPDEFCNRTITVKGLGGKIPKAGTTDKPLELFVGNAGTAARFLAAMVCLGDGVYRLHGVPRMHERPQSALFKALRELGYKVVSENGNDKLPIRISGHTSISRRSASLLVPKFQDDLTLSSPSGGSSSCTVSIAESSQFASALLLSATVGGWQVKITGENAEESPYVAMTSKLIEAFPKKGGTFQIEPDASSGSYFLTSSTLAPPSPEFKEYSDLLKMEVSTTVHSRVEVTNWPNSQWQIDEKFTEFMMHGRRMHQMHELFIQLKARTSKNPVADITEMQQLTEEALKSLNSNISRQHDLGDSIMTAIVLTPLLDDTIHFTDLGRLRVQETERVVALRTELTKCGAKVVEEGDTLTVFPSALHGAEIETYSDHRMAMCFAILGLKVPGIKIKNPACVKKTFPNFFQKLAAPPPQGLGAVIRDGRTGRDLKVEELFAG